MEICENVEARKKIRRTLNSSSSKREDPFSRGRCDCHLTLTRGNGGKYALLS
jgi:hypothetical protein